MRHNFPWLSFWLLYSVGLLCAAAILPFTKRLLSSRIRKPSALRRALVSQFIQNAIILTFAIYFGLEAALATGLARSVTGEWSNGLPGFRAGWLPSVLAATLSAGAVGLLDFYFLMPRISSLRCAGGSTATLPVYHKLLVVLYGGVVEELIMRLGIFTLLLWLSKSLLHWETPPLSVLWCVNGVTALLFAVGHLPVTALLVPLTPATVVRNLLTNSTVGLVFGFSYFTWGLECCILAHTCASVVLQLATGPRGVGWARLV